MMEITAEVTTLELLPEAEAVELNGSTCNLVTCVLVTCVGTSVGDEQH